MSLLGSLFRFLLRTWRLGDLIADLASTLVPPVGAAVFIWNQVGAWQAIVAGLAVYCLILAIAGTRLQYERDSRARLSISRIIGPTHELMSPGNPPICAFLVSVEVINRPRDPVETGRAKQVRAELALYDARSGQLAGRPVQGRWANSDLPKPPPAPYPSDEKDFPPTGHKESLNVAVKYDVEQHAYIFNTASIRDGDCGRLESQRVNPGTYFLRISFNGVPVNHKEWFLFENGVQMSLSPITTPNLSKPERSWRPRQLDA